MISIRKRRAARALIGAICLAAGASAIAGSQTWDFTTDPTQGGELTIGGNNDQPWQAAGGNPGGFLAITYPVDGQYTGVVFPDIDPGLIVTAFTFKCDLRVGNSEGPRGADGFSISFARDGDPLLEEGAISGTAGYTGTLPETGSTTGIAVSFDTWDGNTWVEADGSTGDDLEGIIVRVDNTTVLRQSLPTRHGTCEDPTSLQTGPRDPEFWADENRDIHTPAAWDTICWQPFEVILDNTGKLTVSWKGQKILDAYQTAYFPTAGRLVFGGRTGGENEQTHVDNIVLTTVAAQGGAAPTTPGNPRATAVGARRLKIEWDPSTIPGDPSGRVAYEVEQDGVVVAGSNLTPSYETIGLASAKAYTFRVRGKNVAGVASEWATVTATTVADVDSSTYNLAQVFRTDSSGNPLSGADLASMDAAVGDAKYPNSPDSVYYANGLTFGEPALGNTYGENHLVRIATVLKAPETGQYRFFVRSDDASRLYINTSGAAIPNPASATPIATEAACCGPFEEVGAGDNGDGTFPTSEPVSLTAGQDYGILFLVKEGGGGDWGQVAWRKEGDTTAASSLRPIQGALFQGKADPVGGEVAITQQPANATAQAYKPATFTVAATTASPYAVSAIYQWYKNGAVIAGANSPTLTIPVTQPGDDGAKIKALVGVIGTNMESAEATLTVTANVAPVVTAVAGSDSFNQLTVTFDQPVTAPTATTAANYTADKGLTITSATLVDPLNVRLATSAQTEATEYTLTVNNVQNLGSTPIAAGSTTQFDSWGLVAGRIRADQFTGFTGATLADMDTAIADPKYPNSPDVVRFLNNGFTFGEPAFGDTWGENHLVAMKGILKPTETAQYRFFVRSDDASRLFINTAGAALPDATGTPIAVEAGCCGAFEEVGAGQNPDGDFPTSEPVSLTSGQSYGVLFLVKEGGGGDWGQVAWRTSADTTPAANLAPIKDHVFWYGPPTVAGVTIGIARDGANVRVTYTGTLQGADAVTGPYTDVAGATSPYSTATSGGARYFRARN